ncbi:MAG TPA: hypothetical protein VEI01_15295 [Terriglobales bacterium]|nr:hypothetical protein [Terriglobales bacterium]
MVSGIGDGAQQEIDAPTTFLAKANTGFHFADEVYGISSSGERLNNVSRLLGVHQTQKVEEGAGTRKEWSILEGAGPG